MNFRTDWKEGRKELRERKIRDVAFGEMEGSWKVEN